MRASAIPRARIGARFVYVLRSDSNPSRHYVGRTSSVDDRLEWHNAGPSGYTVEHRPWSMSSHWSSPTNEPLRASSVITSPVPAERSRNATSLQWSLPERPRPCSSSAALRSVSVRRSGGSRHTHIDRVPLLMRLVRAPATSAKALAQHDHVLHAGDIDQTPTGQSPFARSP